MAYIFGGFLGRENPGISPVVEGVEGRRRHDRPSRFALLAARCSRIHGDADSPG